jgi:hypothetical protein
MADADEITQVTTVHNDLGGIDISAGTMIGLSCVVGRVKSWDVSSPSPVGRSKPGCMEIYDKRTARDCETLQVTERSGATGYHKYTHSVTPVSPGRTVGFPTRPGRGWYAGWEVAIWADAGVILTDRIKGGPYPTRP